MRKLVLNGQDLEKPINPDVKSQQADILADVEDKNIGVGNVAYSDAVKDVKKAGEMAAKANKVLQAEEHKEKGENPKMVPGAKKLKLEKLTLDESLFNDDSENDREMSWDYGKHFDDDEEDGIPYDRRAVEQEYGLEEGELDGVSLADAEQIVGEEEGALDRFVIQDEAWSREEFGESLKEDTESFRDEVKKYYDAYRKGIITSSEYGKKFKELKKKHNVKQSDLKDWKNLDEARVSKTTNESLSKSEYDYQKKYASDTLKFHRDALERARKNKAGKEVEKAIQRHIDDIEDFDKKIDSLKEDAKTFLRNVDKENGPQTFTHKNRFNYDIKQVRTNPEDKTYEIGQFSYATPRHTTHNGRDFDRTIQALRDRGYSEKKKEECVKEDLNKDNIYQYMVFSKDGNNVLEAGPIELNSEEELQDVINNAKDLIAKENVGFVLFKGDKIYFNSNEDKSITEGRLPQSPYSHFKNYQRGFNRRTSNKGYKIPLSDRRKEDNDIERRAYRSVRDDIKNQAGEDSIKLAQIAKEKEDEYSKAYNTDSTPENSGKALAAGHLRMSADDYNRLHKLNK